MPSPTDLSIPPGVILGDLIVQGRTLPVRAIMESLAKGRSVEEILHAFPPMTERDLETACRYAAQLAALAKVLEGVEFAILYGSAASGNLRPDSDIDIAVRHQRPLDVDAVIRLVGEISAVFGRDADLLDLHRAGPIIKMQVLRHGRPVIINDTGAFEQFRMYTPSEYFDFKISRRPIEVAIKAERLS